jgi:lipopolysaccharide export LptBFGC system permease protein LptF
MVNVGGVDPALVAIIVILLLVVLAVYLFVRRTLLAFTDGLREGSRRD